VKIVTYFEDFTLTRMLSLE